jgi:hypothetical protein
MFKILLFLFNVQYIIHGLLLTLRKHVTSRKVLKNFRNIMRSVIQIINAGA